jgi:hypothetical protein
MACDIFDSLFITFCNLYIFPLWDVKHEWSRVLTYFKTKKYAWNYQYVFVLYY